MPLASTILLISGLLRMKPQPANMSLNISTAPPPLCSSGSGPPWGRVEITTAATRKVTESIIRPVSTPYCEITNPAIPAPIPIEADQPPEISAFAVRSSSSSHTLGRYAV